MDKQSLIYKITGDEIVCDYNCITITIDSDHFWDEFVVHNGYNEGAINGFDPNSRYGHTQVEYSLDKDEYMSNIPKEVLIEYRQYQLSL